MKVSVQKTEFREFLSPISRISEGTTNSCALTIKKDQIFTVAYTPDIVCIYYAKLTIPEIPDFIEQLTIHIADVKKIITALATIDEEELVLEINEQYISYSSKSMKFKCYLLDKAVATVQKINAALLDEIQVDTEFIIDNAAFSRIIKGCLFSENEGKIYFYTKDGVVYVDIDDKTAHHNVNNITFEVSGEFQGSLLNATTPLSIESFKIIGSLKNIVVTCVNIDKGIYIFKYKNDNIETKYILRGLKS